MWLERAKSSDSIPLYLANEGRFIAIVPEHESARALDVLSQHAVSSGAVRIGQVSDKPQGMVTMKSRLGTERVLDMLSGEQLPRILLGANQLFEDCLVADGQC